MHFLTKLIQNPQLDEPAKKHMDVHRHFYRYSRGEFNGPALKIRTTSNRIGLKGSFEYEDLVGEIIVDTIPDNKKAKFEGVLITGKDISDTIQNLGLDWKLKESTGKTKNFKAKFNQEIEKNTMVDAISTLRTNSYLLLSFNLSSDCKIDTKKRIPRPSKKKGLEDDTNKRVQFSKGYIENTTKNLETVLDKCFLDFKDELSNDWKKLTLKNTYDIEEIALPKDVKNSRMLRIMAIRKGKLTRTLIIDDEETMEKQYSIVV
ncbi:MAG: hypothetical protein BAJALOKI2v1_270017 [Promethearchaeota archaeon]|nr:MAG: hypothetical protein BAJALOKI2v1_270017 [Candidatus Lokiarchaeota archaeon]